MAIIAVTIQPIISTQIVLRIKDERLDPGGVHHVGLTGLIIGSDHQNWCRKSKLFAPTVPIIQCMAKWLLTGVYNL